MEAFNSEEDRGGIVSATIASLLSLYIHPIEYSARLLYKANRHLCASHITHQKGAVRAISDDHAENLIKGCYRHKMYS